MKQIINIILIWFCIGKSVGQNQTQQLIFSNYNKYVDFATKVYISEIDTCINLWDLPDSIGKENQEIVLESWGYMPIELSITEFQLDTLINPLSLDFPKERHEKSPRRLKIKRDSILDLANFHCLYDNPADVIELKESNLYGVYKERNGEITIIEKDIFLELIPTTNGFEIHKYLYSIVNDRVSGQLVNEFYWNRDNDKIRIDPTAENKVKVIEVCLLIGDCKSHHTSTLMEMIGWERRIEKNEEIKNILKLKTQQIFKMFDFINY